MISYRERAVFSRSSLTKPPGDGWIREGAERKALLGLATGTEAVGEGGWQRRGGGLIWFDGFWGFGGEKLKRFWVLGLGFVFCILHDVDWWGGKTKG